MKLSIIVPVFNVEKYLEKCLLSLLSQDIHVSEYEIIVVNDGSTDSSLSIAQALAEQHSNIKIINQENKGLGGARNTGIAKAIGQYILFVDSDDTIEVNSLGRLLEYIQMNHLDMLRFDFQSYLPDGQIIDKKKNATFAIDFGQEVLSGSDFIANKLGWACYVWVFLYNADFLKRTKELFQEHLYFEDLDWLPRVLSKAKRVTSIPYHVYNYLQRPASITQSIDIEKKKKCLTDKLRILNSYVELAKNECNNLSLKKWYEAQVTLIVISVIDYTKAQFPEDINLTLSILKKRNLFPLKTYRFTLKQKLYVFLINISPSLYLQFLSKREKS
jgi:glycosyltransferase involved in cell wall biosynthesis